MAFNKLMRALGFRSEDEDYGDGVEYPSALPVQQSVAHMPETCDQDTQPDDDCEDLAEMSQSEQPDKLDFPLTIFDSLLQVFNDAQPDFIRKCLDVDAQRRYLYDSIDASFKEYIGRYQANVREQARTEAEASSSKLRQELGQLRENGKNVEKLEDDIKHLRISSDRQKRTFNERIRDLEGKVSSVEAEKEQLQLEIKSLLNKVKVASVHEKDAKAYKTDLDNLRKQMKEGAGEEAAQLRENLENANQRVTAMNAQNMAREAEAEQLRKDVAGLRKVIEEQKLRLSELDDSIAAVKADAEARVAEADKRTAEANARADEMETRLAEANKALENRPAVVDTAPSLIVDDVTPSIVEESSGKDAPKLRKRRKKSKPAPTKISAIDETLDETEWLVATPPEGTVIKSVSIASDSDFGYQEPPRKQPPVNDAQMSLF